MTEPIRDPAIRGKTIQFRWTDGPTEGMTHEHVFHPDGTVEWHDAERRADRSDPPERPTYAAASKNDRTAAMVASTCSSLCAVDGKRHSNCEGGR